MGRRVHGESISVSQANNMKTALFILFMIIGSTLGNPIPKDDASDAYIDQVMENLRQLIAENGLDPADLPDGEVGFSETILGIEFHGKAEVHDGFFSGLSTIGRNGDTSFSLNDDTLKLTANIGMGASKAGYSASASFQGIGVSASADIDISKVDVYFSAEMCITGDGCSLQLKDFDIKEIGNIDVHIHGLGPLDWILGTVTGFVADLIRDFLADVLEGPIKDLLQGILNDLLPSL